MRQCGQRGVNGRPTPIYQPASPKQRGRQGSCPNRPVYLATAGRRGDRAVAVYSVPLPQWSHWRGISTSLPSGCALLPCCSHHP